MSRRREGEARGGYLSGRGVVVTRPRGRSGELVDTLRAMGATVFLAPAVEIAPAEEPGPLEAAIREIDRFDWVVFTSASAVRVVRGALEDAAEVRPRRIGAVGPATADAVAAAGWRVDLIPVEATAEGLLAALTGDPSVVPGARVLLPLAEGAGDILPKGLEARGLSVTRVTAYRTVAAPRVAFERVERALATGQVHLLTFTSPSTAASFLDSLGAKALSVPAAVIGPVTRAAAEAMGYRVAEVAEEHTVEGLVEAVVRFFESDEGTS